MSNILISLIVAFLWWVSVKSLFPYPEAIAERLSWAAHHGPTLVGAIVVGAGVNAILCIEKSDE